MLVRAPAPDGFVHSGQASVRFASDAIIVATESRTASAQGARFHVLFVLFTWLLPDIAEYIFHTLVHSARPCYNIVGTAARSVAQHTPLYTFAPVQNRQ